jgi:PhnB protein
MAKTVKPIPSDQSRITPILVVRGGARAIEFYKDVFGAKETIRMEDPSGKIAHADLQIGESHFMLCDEMPDHPDMDARSPESFGGSPVAVYLYVEDVDQVFGRALKAGASPVKPVENLFYGDRAGRIKDPFGHTWWIATRVENVAPDELNRRAAEMYEGQPAS